MKEKYNGVLTSVVVYLTEVVQWKVVVLIVWGTMAIGNVEVEDVGVEHIMKKKNNQSGRNK